MKNNEEYIPAATVHGLYVPGPDDLFELTEEIPLTPGEAGEYPIVIDLDFAPEYDHESIIADLIYDNTDPIPLPDLLRGFTIPRCVPYWFHWFDIPAGELYDKNGRIAHPRAPGIHTVQIRTARKTGAIARRERNFSPANGGWMSPVYTFVISKDESGDPEEYGQADDNDDAGHG
jgi:hypothetical protein